MSYIKADFNSFTAMRLKLMSEAKSSYSKFLTANSQFVGFVVNVFRDGSLPSGCPFTCDTIKMVSHWQSTDLKVSTCFSIVHHVAQTS